MTSCAAGHQLKARGRCPKCNEKWATWRFWKKVRKTRSCWMWEGAKIGPYGKFHIGGNVWKRAHIYAWELENGSVPEGLELDHTCRVKLCVRPSHLEAVTHLENVRRGMAGKPETIKKILATKAARVLDPED